MKKSLSAAALMLLVSGANASTYTLSSVTNFNSFAPTPTPVASCTGCGTGTAVDDGLGNITLTGIAWSYNGGGNQYNIAFGGTATLATGTTLTKSAGATCNDITGNVCSPTGWLASMGVGAFYTGIGSDNSTACANDRCRVDVSLSGSNLIINIKRGLSESATSFNSQTYTLTFVPVPAAAWLFGSALGLLGVMRRKTA